MPSVFAYTTKHGGVASLLYDYRHDDILEASAEVGYGGAFGASGHLLYNGGANRVRADFSYQPRDFLIVGPANLHGLYSDASWSTRVGRRFSADVSASANRYELPRFEQNSITSNGEARYLLTKPLTLIAGYSYGSFSGSGMQQDVRSLTLPVGVQADFSRFGIGLLYRYATNSASNEGGHGFRATMRASLGSVFASGYFDRQTDAPTLELILRDDPALSLALQQLGRRPRRSRARCGRMRRSSASASSKAPPSISRRRARRQDSKHRGSVWAHCGRSSARACCGIAPRACRRE